jgi:hypothetical protein
VIKRLVLAYSGGLETSVAIPWLAEKYGAEIITVSMDLGQGKELDDVRDRALASGALRAHVLDLREEFARDFILPALQAGAVYEASRPHRADRRRHSHRARFDRAGQRPGAHGYVRECARPEPDDHRTRARVGFEQG